VESKIRVGWTSKDDLATAVSTTLSEQMVAFPRTGWVRASQAINQDTINEMARLSRENSELHAQMSRLQGTTPMPELDVKLTVVRDSFQWYELVKRGGGGMYSSIDRLNQPPVELSLRTGYVLRIVVSNSGDLATDFSIEASSADGIIEPRDVENFNKKDESIVRLSHIINRRSGWEKAEYPLHGSGYSRWIFKGNVYSLKSGQAYQFEVPLSDVVETANADNVKIEVKVFPETGKHIEKTVLLRDALPHPIGESEADATS
jgi:hypothetical protein